MRPRIRHGRKLLVASLGVAAVSYVACGGNTTSNPTPSHPDAADVQNDFPVGNLAVPQPDAASEDVQQEFNPFDVVANLMAPPDGGAQ